VLPLIRSLTRAPRSQRLAVAEGLATVKARTGHLPLAEAERWMQAELLAAIEDSDPALSLRAINAVKPLDHIDKAAPLRRVALGSAIRESNRVAAVRALALDSPSTEPILIDVLESDGSNGLRRAAADLLGTAGASAAARRALVEAFVTASADVALSLATALARSNAGAAELIELAASGRVRPTLLRHRHVVVLLEKRPAALQERVAILTRTLPPEDARLDAIIAQRLGATNTIKPDVGQGARVFAQHCASCHQVRDTGGNLGPNLDGIASRNLPRLIEDVIDPSRNIDPAFRMHTVMLKDGTSKPGMNLREESGRVFLIDPATGEKMTFAQADVAEITHSLVSPMPAVFDALLSDQELFDVLAFIRGPAK
jgi:putative heme-binding domain-containing protein